MKKNKLIAIAILAVLMVVGIAIYSRPQPNATVDGKTHKQHVKIGIQTSPAMALVMTAQEKGYFRDEGIDVELVPFTAGKFALQALLGGSLDYCVSGEVPIALATLQGNKLTVLSQVVKETKNEVRVVARKDDSAPAGANSYFKSKKRKLATSMGGGPEFFTYEFMKTHGISSGDVELIAQKPEDMPAALASGSVDAISVFDPFAYIAEQKLGNAAITFSDTTGKLYSEFYVLSVGEKQLDASKTTAPAILRALNKAGSVIKNDPATAKAAVHKYTELEASTIDGIWNSFQFEVALTTKLIDVWEAQAKWAISTGKSPPGTKIPEFRSIIDENYLKKINPEAVTLPAK